MNSLVIQWENNAFCDMIVKCILEGTKALVLREDTEVNKNIIIKKGIYEVINARIESAEEFVMNGMKMSNKIMSFSLYEKLDFR